VFILAGFALVYPGPVADTIGFGGVIVALASQFLRRRTASSATL